MATAATDNASGGSHPRRHLHTVAMSSTFFYVVIGVLMCLSVSCSASGYNASLYVNSDIAINSLFSGPKLVMLVNTSPVLFSPNAFVEGLYRILSKVDTAIANVNSVYLVNWCATSLESNTTLSCAQDAKNTRTQPLLLAQVQLNAWNHTSLSSPASVDLSSVGVVMNFLVHRFNGTYNRDNNSAIDEGNYAIDFTSNSVVAYVMFVFLVSIAMFALIGVGVCVCLCDSHYHHNKGIVERFIRNVHFNYLAMLYARPHYHHHHQQQQPVPASVSEPFSRYASIPNNGFFGAPHDSPYCRDAPKSKRNEWEYLHQEDDAPREMQEIGHMRP
ncbi:hypothetical protein, unknown function [Leishmania tarentolae]|uniref:Uncharacterized protein n=1 Tax=Leishmania tarentolae TaxID=5689 RepID=A0A640KPW2_LEITA|nr:hypothetical protein, unknown function [Leishmania tarentolae]